MGSVPKTDVSCSVPERVPYGRGELAERDLTLALHAALPAPPACVDAVER